MNYKLKSHILEVVENQLKMNDPKCTKQTLKRLVNSGFEAGHSKEMIAAVLAEEMWYVMHDEEPFNPKRYEKKLSSLPEYLETGKFQNTIRTKKAEPAIGRNEPCPCGSGKKFKRCCG